MQLQTILHFSYTYVMNFITYLLLTYLLTRSTQHSLSWGANRFSSSQEISRILWKPKFHYRNYKCLSPFPILIQINLVHVTHTTSWRCILILSYYLRVDLPSSLFPLCFLNETMYKPLLSLIRTTCTALTSRFLCGNVYCSNSIICIVLM